MPWIEITEAHLRARLAKSEIDAFVAVGRQYESGVDLLENIIQQVTTMVRSKVASWPENIPFMAPGNSIPQECLFAATTIIRDALIGSLPLSESSTDLRREELRKAHEFLDKVASGEVLIEGVAGGYQQIATSSAGAFGGNQLLEF